jgi:hypothetical protein
MTNDEAGLARAEMFRKPTVRVPTAAEQLMNRRAKAAVHKQQYEQIRRLEADIAGCNTRIVSYGGSAVSVDVPAVLEDLPNKASLDDLHRRLNKAFSEARSRLEQLKAEAEEERWREMLASETPLERKVRELEEEIAELKAGRHQEAPPQRDIQPSRHAPPMPFTTPNLLSAPGSYGCAPAGAPPVTPHSRRGAAVVLRRGGGVQASGPAMPNVDTLTLRPSSPADFVRAMQRDFVR